MTPQSSVTCAPERFRDFRTVLNHPLIQAPILLHYYLLVTYLNFQSDWMRSWCPCSLFKFEKINLGRLF